MPEHGSGLKAVLDHVQLAMPTGGEEAARRFYNGVLGLSEVAKPEPMRTSGGVWFEPGLHLGVEADFRPARKAHPGLGMVDLDGAAARLEAAGAGIDWDDRWPGVRRLYTHDPFGNRLELIEARASLGPRSAVWATRRIAGAWHRLFRGRGGRSRRTPSA